MKIQFLKQKKEEELVQMEVKSCIEGSAVIHFLILQRTWVQLPVPTLWLLISYNFTLGSIIHSSVSTDTNYEGDKELNNSQHLSIYALDRFNSIEMEMSTKHTSQNNLVSYNIFMKKEINNIQSIMRTWRHGPWCRLDKLCGE